MLDLGHAGALSSLLDMGLIDAPRARGFRAGCHGPVPPTARNLVAMVNNLRSGWHHWGVIGISRAQWPMLAAASFTRWLARVGLNDNFHLPDREMARSNGDLIATARQMPYAAGQRPATVDEARARLCIDSQAPAMNYFQV